MINCEKPVPTFSHHALAGMPGMAKGKVRADARSGTRAAAKRRCANRFGPKNAADWVKLLESGTKPGKFIPSI
jgi:hypothetical protein